jgi:uncharacterized membrane protein HdeD (DUF308 family)
MSSDGRGPDAAARDVVIAAVIPALGVVRGLIWLQNSPRAGWQMIIAALVGVVIWTLVLNGTL